MKEDRIGEYVVQALQGKVRTVPFNTTLPYLADIANYSCSHLQDPWARHCQLRRTSLFCQRPGRWSTRALQAPVKLHLRNRYLIESL